MPVAHQRKEALERQARVEVQANVARSYEPTDPTCGGGLDDANHLFCLDDANHRLCRDDVDDGNPRLCRQFSVSRVGSLLSYTIKRRPYHGAWYNALPQPMN